MTADAKPALPPLPEPAYPTTATGGAFDHQQMRAYARANLDAAIAQARRDERERCAKACEAQYNGNDWIDGITVANKCAAAIRALADKPEGA